MEFPEFRNDDEIAAFFEAHDVDADDLDVADDVAIAPDLLVTLAAEVYTLTRPSSAASSENVAVTVDEGDRNRELTPALY